MLMPLNRTTIRLALALARSDGREVDKEHVQITVNLSHQFEKELQVALGAPADDDPKAGKEKSDN